ncbi:MAG: ABC transporter permease [Actinobacteria bacterium]|nr:ABC transporter permease [Actinomycetota bacterium]
MLWLAVFFLLPLYTVISIAFGTVDPILRTPIPVWQPWWWTTTHVAEGLDKAFGPFRSVYVRTFAYVLIATGICLILGYTVAYFVARHAGRRKRVLLLVLLVSPFWISYLMRMLAWINLLQPDGYLNRVLSFLHLAPEPVGWLEGRPITVILGLVYGYIPYMILPLYAFLDRIEPNLLEAGRDLGASPARTFVRVTLPMSKPGILAALVIVALPMFGDYFTNSLLSGSPSTTMIGNLIDDSINTTGQQPEAAVLILILMAILIVPMWFYLRATDASAADR